MNQRFHRRLVPLAGICLGIVPLAVATSGATPPSGARYVGDETCLSCHEDRALASDDVHHRIESFEVRGHAVGCEGCHGPGSIHAEEMDPETIRVFASGTASDSDSACSSCHQRKGLQRWHASTHAAVGVGCTDCHTVHARRPSGSELAVDRFPGPSTWNRDPTDPFSACQTCHADTVARFELPYRHPVRDGRMDCGDCHDPHGAGEAMLRSRLRPDEVCFDCHQSIEGPHVFEHPPVAEGCSTCHTPHGSVVPRLLTASEPSLCVQCHDYHFHAGYRASDDHEVDVGGIARENPLGPHGFNMAFTTKCTQCHTQVHGSDLPSQTITGLGRGLTP